MARRRSQRGQLAEIAFDAISIEGGLLAAEWLSRVAQLGAEAQTEADYRVPKGLNLRDEIGRYWRIAQAHWSDLQSGRGAQADPAALAESFVRKLLVESLGFASLTPVGQATVGERTYPVRLFALDRRVPIVIVPLEVSLDAPLAELGDGTRRRSAFGLLQEFLNAADSTLWGLVCDGLTLRLGRDNASLTRPAWVEADLGRIFTEQLYPDFAALWLLIHESRFGQADQPPEDCALETWRTAGREEGIRARDKLRGGFEAALRNLGEGFVSHAPNTALRAALHDGSLSREGLYGELLRLVYRIIFSLAIEERGLLHPKKTADSARELYAGGYALQRLRDRSVRRSNHDRHDDQWEAVKIVFSSLAKGEPSLGLPALAGIFAAGQCPHLDAARLENRSLMGALFHLGWLREPTGLTRVNWRDMGADELGYVYEGLLELVPQITEDGRSFAFAGVDESRGHARKTTGSYYTPDELVQVLLDTALEPVVERTVAAHPEDPAAALLELTVVDPACGSGHFLLAAARRLAEHLARLRFAGTPTGEDYRHALREVIRRCIYGVDMNPLAVELCKVGLWMEAVEPGLPLTFLEAHIRHGNSLLGTTRELMGDRVPDEAWVALEGDDKRVASSLKKRNKQERAGGQLLLFSGSRESDESLQEAMQKLESVPDSDTATLARKERQWQALLSSDSYLHQKLVADAWCAAFVWPKGEPSAVTDGAPTTSVWLALRDDPGQAPALLVETTREIAEQYDLFHWELAFPQVFARGGFAVVLGNPPWEHLEIKEQEYFATREPEIANAKNAAARKKLIAALPSTDSRLWAQWQSAKNHAQGAMHLARNSGRFPLCARGRINTYPLFAEHNWKVLAPEGRAGFITPSGLVTDDNTKAYFQALLDRGALASVFHFENAAGIFKDVHRSYCFVLMTIGRADRADFVFYARRAHDLGDEERHFALTPQEFELLNPNTRTCPTFRSRRDAQINLAIYRRAGVLWREDDPDGNTWGLRFMQGLFNMASDSGLFRRREELNSAGWGLEGNGFVKDGQVMLPLYEAKMVHHFDHRFGTYEAQTQAQANQGKLSELDDTAHADPHRITLPRYWVDQQHVEAKLEDAWDREWLLGWRDVCRSTDRRTVIASLIPRAGVGHKMPLVLPSADASSIAALYANLSSFVLDYATRQKIGGISLTYFVLKQLPVLAPAQYSVQAPWHPTGTVGDWLLPRVLELTCTAWDLQPFAEDCGDDGPPFIWDPARRFQLQCEINAAFFRLYGIARDDVDYILDTFLVVRKSDEQALGEYRTKRVILEIYDALAKATARGRPYVSPLPPPKRAD